MANNSTVSDLIRSYGKKHNIAVTNMTGTEITNSELIKNGIIISAIEDEGNGIDKNITSMFITDNSGHALRLTYTIQPGNGLVIGAGGVPADGSQMDNSDIISMAIDKYSIRTNPSTEGLYVQCYNIIDNYTLTTQPYGYYGDYISVVTYNLDKAENGAWGVVRASNPLTAVNIEHGELSIITDKLDYVDDDLNVSGIVRFQPDDNDLLQFRTIEASKGNLHVITKNLDIATKENAGVVKVDNTYTYINEKNELTLKDFRYAEGKVDKENASFAYYECTNINDLISYIENSDLSLLEEDLYYNDNDEYKLLEIIDDPKQYLLDNFTDGEEILYRQSKIINVKLVHGIVAPDLLSTYIGSDGIISVNTQGLEKAATDKFGVIKLAEREFGFDASNTTYIKRYGEMIGVINDFYKYKTRTEKEIQDLSNRVAALEAAAAAAKIYSFVCTGADITELPVPTTDPDTGVAIDTAVDKQYSVTFSVSTNCKFKVSVKSDANNVNPAISLIDVRQGSDSPIQITGGSVIDHNFESTEGNETTLKFTFTGQNYSSETDESKRDTIFTFEVTSIGENAVHKKAIHTFIRHNLTKYTVEPYIEEPEVIVPDKPDSPRICSQITSINVIQENDFNLLQKVNFGATSNISAVLNVVGDYTHTTYENANDEIGTQVVENNVALETLNIKPKGNHSDTDAPDTIYYELDYYRPLELTLPYSIGVVPKDNLPIRKEITTYSKTNTTGILKYTSIIDKPPVAMYESAPLVASLLSDTTNKSLASSMDIPVAVTSNTTEDTTYEDTTYNYSVLSINKRTSGEISIPASTYTFNETAQRSTGKGLTDSTTASANIQKLIGNINTPVTELSTVKKDDFIPYSVVKDWKKIDTNDNALDSEKNWINTDTVRVTKNSDDQWVLNISSNKGIINERSTNIKLYYYDKTNNDFVEATNTFYTEQLQETRPTVTANIQLLNGSDDIMSISLSRSENARLVGNNNTQYWCTYIAFTIDTLMEAITNPVIGKQNVNTATPYQIAGFTEGSLLAGGNSNKIKQLVLTCATNSTQDTFKLTKSDLARMLNIDNENNIDLGSNNYAGITIKSVTTQSFTYALGPAVSYNVSGQWIPSTDHIIQYYWNNAFVYSATVEAWDDIHMYVKFNIRPGNQTLMADDNIIVDMIDSTFKLKFIKNQHTFDWSDFYTHKYINNPVWSPTGCTITVHLYNLVSDTPLAQGREIVVVKRFDDDNNILPDTDFSDIVLLTQPQKTTKYVSNDYSKVANLLSSRLNVENKQYIDNNILSSFNYIKFNFSLSAFKEDTVQGKVYKTGSLFKVTNNDVTDRFGFSTGINSDTGATIAPINLTNANYVSFNVMTPAVNTGNQVSNDTISNLINELQNVQNQVNTMQETNNVLIHNRFLN